MIPLEILNGMDSELESEFAMRWEEKYPRYKLQHHFLCVPGRRYEADFTHHESGVILEINGGTWQKNRTGHASGSGIGRDYKKAILVAELGYQILMLDCKMADTGKLDDDWMDRARNVIDLRLKTVTLPFVENKHRRMPREHYPVIYTADYVDALNKK